MKFYNGCWNPHPIPNKSPSGNENFLIILTLGLSNLGHGEPSLPPPPKHCGKTANGLEHNLPSSTTKPFASTGFDAFGYLLSSEAHTFQVIAFCRIIKIPRSLYQFCHFTEVVFSLHWSVFFTSLKCNSHFTEVGFSLHWSDWKRRTPQFSNISIANAHFTEVVFSLHWSGFPTSLKWKR